MPHTTTVRGCFVPVLWPCQFLRGTEMSAYGQAAADGVRLQCAGCQGITKASTSARQNKNNRENTCKTTKTTPGESALLLALVRRRLLGAALCRCCRARRPPPAALLLLLQPADEVRDRVLRSRRVGAASGCSTACASRGSSHRQVPTWASRCEPTCTPCQWRFARILCTTSSALRTCGCS